MSNITTDQAMEHVGQMRYEFDLLIDYINDRSRDFNNQEQKLIDRIAELDADLSDKEDEVLSLKRKIVILEDKVDDFFTRTLS